MNKKILIYSLIFIALIISVRLFKILPNFTPVAAIALAAGVYLGKKWALILPLAGLFISDIFIGFYEWKLMLAVYGSFLLIGFIGWWLKKNKSAVNIVSASFLASLLFFITTNFAVWIFAPWYAKSTAGLLYCFELALPFFRYTLMGDIFFTVTIFGAIELALYFAKVRKKASSENFI